MHECVSITDHKYVWTNGTDIKLYQLSSINQTTILQRLTVSFRNRGRNIALCNIQMSKNFLKAINDIRRQRDKQTHKRPKGQKEESGGEEKGEGEMPSLLREKLKALADFKKKIVKEAKGKEEKQGREKAAKEDSKEQPHDEGSSQNVVGEGGKDSKNGGIYIPPALKTASNKGSPQPKLAITFTESPGYNTILGLVKNIKIYICEINDSMVSFNRQEAYSNAKDIFLKAGLKFIAA